MPVTSRATRAALLKLANLLRFRCNGFELVTSRATRAALLKHQRGVLGGAAAHLRVTSRATRAALLKLAVSQLCHMQRFQSPAAPPARPY